MQSCLVLVAPSANHVYANQAPRLAAAEMALCCPQVRGAEPIVLEENVWLGGGVIVNPGVRIGTSSVIGSGSVVTRDIPAHVFAAGSPARVVRELRTGAES